MEPILYYRPSGIAIHEAILIKEMILLSFFIASNKSSSLSSSLSPNYGEILTNMLLDGASLVFQMIKICLQCVRCRFDPWVRRSPGKENGWEDPLEKGKATHSSVLD